MTIKIDRDSIKKVLNFVSAKGGGVSEEKLASFTENMEAEETDSIANLCGMNYLSKIYEHASDGLVEVVYVITPKGRAFIGN